MSEVQIFHATLDGARELKATPFRNEKELQGLVERHLRDLTGIDFVATEHRTGSRHKRRADTLGLDSNQRPVVIEYKLGHGGAAISQGLDYLFWLQDHRGDFRELVRGSLGADRSRNIDFKKARLLCVAGEFRREDIINAETNTRRIDLLSVRRHGESAILLEWVYGGGEVSRPIPVSVPTPVPEPPNGGGNSWHEQIASDEALHNLLTGLFEYLKTLEVEVQPIKWGFSVKRERGGFFNLLRIWPKPGEAYLMIELKFPQGTVPFEEGFIRDISQIKKFGGNTHMIYIRNHRNLERARPLIKRSYDEAG